MVQLAAKIHADLNVLQDVGCHGGAIGKPGAAVRLLVLAQYLQSCEQLRVNKSSSCETNHTHTHTHTHTHLSLIHI